VGSDAMPVRLHVRIRAIEVRGTGRDPTGGTYENGGGGAGLIRKVRQLPSYVSLRRLD